MTRNEDQNADPIEIVDPNEETDEPTVLAHFNAPAKASVGTNEAAGQFRFRTVPKHGDKRAYDTDRTTASNRYSWANART